MSWKTCKSKDKITGRSYLQCEVNFLEKMKSFYKLIKTPTTPKENGQSVNKVVHTKGNTIGS